MASPCPTTEIRQLVSAIGQNIDLLTSNSSRLRRHVAAAGLVRCQALLEASCLLCEAGRDDVVGVLSRALCEVWLVSFYVLLKGKDQDDQSVIEELEASHLYWLEKFAKQNAASDLDLAQWRQTVKEPHPLNYADLAKAVGELLTEAEGEPADVMTLYDRMYQAESIFSAHASFGSLTPYVVTDQNDRHAIRAKPDAAFPAGPIVAAELTAHLALHVYRTFGIRTTEIEQILPLLKQAVRGMSEKDSEPET
jgi:hypothetical protein